MKIKHGTRDLRSYFSAKAKENNKETRSVKVNLTPELVQTLEHVTSADAAAVNTELKTASSIQRRGKYVLNIPPRIKAEVGKYALSYGTQAARKSFSSKYPQYEFKRSTVNNWKNKFTKYPDRTEDKFQ